MYRPLITVRVVSVQGVSLTETPRDRDTLPWQRTPGHVTGDACWDREHPVNNRMTDRCKNITLPQTSFEGGNNLEVFKVRDVKSQVGLLRVVELWELVMNYLRQSNVFVLNPIPSHHNFDLNIHQNLNNCYVISFFTKGVINFKENPLLLGRWNASSCLSTVHGKQSHHLSRNQLSLLSRP